MIEVASYTFGIAAFLLIELALLQYSFFSNKIGVLFFTAIWGFGLLMFYAIVSGIWSIFYPAFTDTFDIKSTQLPTTLFQLTFVCSEITLFLFVGGLVGYGFSW
jgi:hypothetical protein